VASGGRSPGMNTFASHPGHVTMRKGVSLMLVPIYHPLPAGQVLRRPLFFKTEKPLP
jgi:hypothetical protein